MNRMDKVLSKSKISIVYRARTHSTSSEEYLPLAKCLLSSVLMKSLKLKAGAFVLLEKSNGEFFLSKCWPCKASQLANDIVFLSKNWQASFDSEEKKTVINCQQLSRIRIVECYQLEVSSSFSPASSSSSSANIITLLTANLQDIYARSGLKFSLPIIGVYHEFEISAVSSKEDISSTHITFYRVTPNTQISLRKRDQTDEGVHTTVLKRENVKEKRFVGHSNLRSNLLNTLEENLLFPTIPTNKIRGILIHGPPGVGKSQLVDDVTQTVKCSMIKIDHCLLLHSVEGEAEAVLRRIFLEARVTAPTILFIDHFDLLFPQRSAATTTDLQKRIVTTFLTLMDEVKVEDRITVIACTSKILDIDEAAKRSGRMDIEVEIPIPNESDRFEILQYLSSSQGVQVIDTNNKAVETVEMRNDQGREFMVRKSTLEAISKNAHGMVGADLLQVMKESFFLLTSSQLMNLRPANKSDSVAVALDMDDEIISSSLQSLSLEDSASEMVTELTESIMEAALKKVTPSSLREVTVEVPTVRWTDIGGMEKVKQSLRQVIELPLKHPELFKQSGMTALKGVLLYGPPGCSKTLMAKAVATETSMNFLAVRGPELLSKWLGDSEKAVQSLFRKARAAAPSIIFFDEIDALAGVRGDSSSGVSDRVLSQLLVELDGINSQKHVIVIAATNRPDMLDAALIRPGRIDRKIYVSPPDDASRKSILELELKKLPHDPNQLDFVRLVQLTEGFSGAEVVSVVNDAVLYAIERNEEVIISMQCLEHALSKIVPQITSQMLSFYEKIEAAQFIKG